MLNFGASKPRVKGGPPGSAPGHNNTAIDLSPNAFHRRKYYENKVS